MKTQLLTILITTSTCLSISQAAPITYLADRRSAVEINNDGPNEYFSPSTNFIDWIKPGIITSEIRNNGLSFGISAYHVNSYCDDCGEDGGPYSYEAGYYATFDMTLSIANRQTFSMNIESSFNAYDGSGQADFSIYNGDSIAGSNLAFDFQAFEDTDQTQLIELKAGTYRFYGDIQAYDTFGSGTGKGVSPRKRCRKRCQSYLLTFRKKRCQSAYINMYS